MRLRGVELVNRRLHVRTVDVAFARQGALVEVASACAIRLGQSVAVERERGGEAGTRAEQAIQEARREHAAVLRQREARRVQERRSALWVEVGGVLILLEGLLRPIRRLVEFTQGEHGVRVVGGCCGTTPEHIGAIHDKVAPLLGRRLQGNVFYQAAA